MPLVRLETTVALSEEKRQTLLATLSKIATETIGKPEEYLMVTITPAAMLMSGKSGDAAFIDVRSIGGLGGDVTRVVSERVCALLHESLGIPPKRIYLNFAEINAGNWGWNGETFG
jgi:phenylpyruvate tautomerase PptA (4-oxalocrotonate tautomerase family)